MIMVSGVMTPISNLRRKRKVWKGSTKTHRRLRRSFRLLAPTLREPASGLDMGLNHSRRMGSTTLLPINQSFIHLTISQTPRANRKHVLCTLHGSRAYASGISWVVPQTLGYFIVSLQGADEGHGWCRINWNKSRNASHCFSRPKTAARRAKKIKTYIQQPPVSSAKKITHTHTSSLQW